MVIDSIKNLPLTVKSAGNGLWTFTWASTGAAAYRVSLYGRLLAVTTSLIYTTANYSVTAPPVEVSELNWTVGEVHPCRFLFQWFPVDDAIYYLVEKYVSGSWRFVCQIPAANEVRSYVTPTFLDSVNVMYRVTAYNSAGEGSSPLAFNRTVVASPPAPAVSVSYGGGNVTVELPDA